MLRFRRMRSLQKFAALHGSIHNHFNQERALFSRQNFAPRTFGSRIDAPPRWPHGVNSARPEQGGVGAISEAFFCSSDSTRRWSKCRCRRSSGEAIVRLNRPGKMNKARLFGLEAICVDFPLTLQQFASSSR
jgi:hypothetical protein